MKGDFMSLKLKRFLYREKKLQNLYESTLWFLGMMLLFFLALLFLILFAKKIDYSYSQLFVTLVYCGVTVSVISFVGLIIMKSTLVYYAAHIVAKEYAKTQFRPTTKIRLRNHEISQNQIDSFMGYVIRDYLDSKKQSNELESRMANLGKTHIQEHDVNTDEDITRLDDKIIEFGINQSKLQRKIERLQMCLAILNYRIWLKPDKSYPIWLKIDRVNSEVTSRMINHSQVQK